MLLKELTQTFGVSGYEREVRDLIRKAVMPYADEINVDAIGNLIVFKKGTAEDRKKVMLAAHMDEIGFQVTKIDEKGRIKFKSLGNVLTPITYLCRVRFRSGITGIVSCTVKTEELKDDLTKLFIDIGAHSEEEVKRYIKIGDVACYDGEYRELVEGNITAKAIDNRIGCYILAETIKRVKPVNDLYFVFTVQEEVNCSGSIVAAERINPDIGIAVDVTYSHDYSNDFEGSNILGAGTAIKISDASVICDEYLVDEMVKCCEEQKIKYQMDVISIGGTDAGSINRSNFGVKAAGVSVATRYFHSPNAIVSMKDAEASIKLLCHYLNRTFRFPD